MINLGGVNVGTGKKIHKSKDGYLLGAAGSFGAISMFFDWFDDDDEDKPPLESLKVESLDAIIINPMGKIALLDSGGWPMDIKAPFYSLGSGADIALGAMAAGADAVEAVRIAIKYNTTCGGAIQKLKL